MPGDDSVSDDVPGPERIVLRRPEEEAASSGRHDCEKGAIQTVGRTLVCLALLLGALTVSLAFGGAGSALTTSASQRQVSPGVQQRVIWGEVQVAHYQVRVSHTGNLHAEVSFTPTSNICGIFIWDAATMRIQNIEQGRHLIGEGSAAVDFHIPDISPEGRVVVDPDASPGSGDERLQGDVYNVIVVSYGGRKTSFRVWGYGPQTDLHAGAGSDPTAEGNVYYTAFRRPASGWRSLAGARLGWPFLFRPTSEGEVRCDLTWPADVVERRVLPDLGQGRAPAVWEQYLSAGTGWTVVMQDPLTSSGTWWPPMWGSGAAVWWGLSNAVAVKATDPWAKPMRWFRYTPVLDLVSSDPAQGPAAPLKTSVVTMGFRATLTWPANLRITATPRVIRRGARATLQGTFALDGAWAAGAPVTVQKLVSGAWRRVATVVTTADGKWTLRVRPSTTTVYRTRAPGDDATGLATETSPTVRVRVR